MPGCDRASYASKFVSSTKSSTDSCSGLSEKMGWERESILLFTKLADNTFYYYNCMDNIMHVL